MKYLKKIIIGLIILMSIIVICIVVAIKQGKETIENTQKGDSGEKIEFNKIELETLTDKIRFFTVKNCVQQFLNEINTDSQKAHEFTEQEIRQERYNLLSKEYINNNDITVDNINSNLKTINTKAIFDALQIKYLKGEKIENYIVYGIMTSLNNEYMGNIYVRVNMDRENKTFSIEPISGNYNSIDDISIRYNDDSIEKKDNNIYIEQSMTYENIAKTYFATYKRLVLARPEIIYNYLQNDYKEKRFENLSNFEKYVNSNKNEISQLIFKKYQVNNNDEFLEVICTDQYQNLYIFEEISPMNFTLRLDTYTILSDKYKSTYDSQSNQQKVAMNIENWVNMLNQRDYINAYKMLDDTFKDNNLKTEQEFENYIKAKLPLHYSIEYTTYSNEGSTYAQTIKLSDITEKTSETITMNVIMQLKNNYDYVMSFSID
jgi:hypothetical protein